MVQGSWLQEASQVLPLILPGQQMARSYTQSWAGLWLSPYLGRRWAELHILQGSLFESFNQAVLHPAKFPGQTALQSVFCRWEKLLVGTITWVLWEELSLPRPMCWLLQAPSFSITTRFSVGKPHTFLHNPCGARPEWGQPRSNP